MDQGIEATGMDLQKAPPAAGTIPSNRDFNHKLRELNNALDQLHVPYDVNEGVIMDFLDTLENHCGRFSDAYWLLMARVAELAVLCAAHYADNGECKAAGDFISNPGKILMHFRDCPPPDIGMHRESLFHQVDGENRRQLGLVRKLREEMYLDVIKPGLLPYLFDRLGQSQRMAMVFLAGLHARAEVITNTIRFLARWRFAGSEAFWEWFLCASGHDRQTVQAHLCGFNTDIYEQLGNDYRCLSQNPFYQSRFLRHGVLYPVRDQEERFHNRDLA